MKKLFGFALIAMTLASAFAAHAQDLPSYGEAQIDKDRCHADEQRSNDLVYIIRHDEKELEDLKLSLAVPTDSQKEIATLKERQRAASARLEKDIAEQTNLGTTPASCLPQN